MGEILIQERTEPDTPDTGYNSIYVDDSTGHVTVKHDDGSTNDLETAGVGEVNTASNVGTAGVGIFKQKSDVDLEFKKLNAGSNKVTITDDTDEDEVDIDVAEANIVHDNLSGFVANEHVDHSGVTLTAGVGLSGGGDITASRTFDLEDTAVTPGSYGSATETVSLTVDQQGRLTAASEQAISIPSTQVTDFTEASQDAVGAMVDDSSNVSLTYTDGTPSLVADLTDTAVTPDSYGSASAVATFTVDQKGRLTAAGETNISIASTAVSDFTEAAQDAVGAALADSSTIDFTYTDGSNEITASVIQAALTLDNLGGTLGISKGGTGQTTQTTAMDALSPTTTKGDLLVDDGTNVVRQAVGGNNEVLVADSSATNGVAYEDYWLLTQVFS